MKRSRVGFNSDERGVGLKHGYCGGDVVVEVNCSEGIGGGRRKKRSYGFIAGNNFWISRRPEQKLR